MMQKDSMHVVSSLVTGIVDGDVNLYATLKIHCICLS